MDYLKIITAIINRLRQYGYIDVAQEIESLEIGASTGTELIMSVTHALLGLINSNDTYQKLIGKEVIELKDYCWSIGLHVS